VLMVRRWFVISPSPELPTIFASSLVKAKLRLFPAWKQRALVALL
jgi:hypothetical protein